MTEPIAYLNGQYAGISQTRLSVFDLGVVQGAAVTEMIRTYAHRPFRLGEHLDRLDRSLRYVGFECPLTRQELETVTERVVGHNAGLIPQNHDLGIVIFVTAGENLTYVGAAGAERARRPSLCVHTFPLPFELWAAKLDDGQHLVTPAVRHIPPDSLDPKIKYRSRLHWYLADKQARLADPKAGALLLDHDGNLTETSSGNFLIVQQGRIFLPPPRSALGGVSQQVALELAGGLGLEYEHADLRIYDAVNADEAFTSSTPYALLPVTRLNGTPIGTGRPGPVFAQLMEAWSALVGFDVLEQIRTGARERQTESAS